MNTNQELLLEIWSRIKSHIIPAERVDVADTLVEVFDEFGFISDDLLDEDLDREMRLAATNHLEISTDDDEEDNDADWR